MYLAGPLGFSAAGRLYHETVLRPAVEATGWRVLDPWEADPAEDEIWAARPGSPQRARLAELVREIGARNTQLIDNADVVLAVLDGSDVDSGTAAEIGYAAARGKRVIGLRLDVRLTGDCEAVTVNLQVEYYILLHEGSITRTLDEAIRALGEPG